MCLSPLAALPLGWMKMPAARNFLTNAASFSLSTSTSPSTVYDKLKGIEPGVSRGLTCDTAKRMQAIIDRTGGISKPPLAGYRTKILDGNHLCRTDRRIGELRDLNAAPLPGQALVVFEPQYRLVVDVLPCEDGHAQERSLLPELLKTIAAKDLWIADRNFCTVGFLFGIAGRSGKFIIEHAFHIAKGGEPAREFFGRYYFFPYEGYFKDTYTCLIYSRFKRLSYEQGCSLYRCLKKQGFAFRQASELVDDDDDVREVDRIIGRD